MRDISEYDVSYAIQLKNHILTFSPDKLVELYGNNNYNYLLFLDTIVVLSVIDPVFFALDKKIVDRVRMVINSRKFDSTNQRNIDCINSIIIMCNRMEQLDDNQRNEIIAQYFVDNSSIRNLEISSLKQMYGLIIYDAVVYYAIVKNDFDDVKSEGFFLGSLSYLIEYIPSLFNEEKYKNEVMGKLDEIYKRKGLFRKAIKQYSLSVKEKINDIGKKEE